MKRALQSPLANVLLFSIFWAIEIFIAKLAFLNGAQVVRFSLQANFVALIIVFIYILPNKIKEFKKISFSTIRWLLLGNAIILGIGGFLGNAGLQLTTAINAGFLSQFSTIATAIFARLIIGEKITKAKIISILTILLGTFLLVTKGQLIIPHTGDILILLSCLCYGLGPTIIKKKHKTTPINADLVAFLRPVAGIPTILLFMLLSPLYPASIQKIFQVNIFEADNVPYVILNGIALALIWIFVNRTLKIASVTYTALMSSLTPILVAILAIIFLNEKVDGIQLIGISLIIASSFIVQYLKFDKH